MKTISTSEFRRRQKAYLKKAETEHVIIHRNKGKSFLLVPIDEVDETAYLLSTEANKEHLIRSIQDSKSGKGRQVNPDDLWK